MFRKILVSFDGSDHAEAAIRVAADLADKYRGDLEIVYVPEIQTTAIAVGSGAVEIPVNEEETRRHAEDLLARAEGVAQQAGYTTASTRVLRGSPAEAILAHATETSADLIVAGRRGLGTLRGLLVGSVSQKLTSHAVCPVLTVH